MPTKRTPTKKVPASISAPVSPTGPRTRSKSPLILTPAIPMSAAAEAAKKAAADAAAATVPAGINPEFFMYMQRLEKMDARAEKICLEDLARMEATRKEDRERAEKDRYAQQKLHEKQIEAITAQLSKVTSTHNESAKPPTAKLPIFDIESGSEHFNLWKDRWEIHIKANRIHLIKDEEEKQNRLMLELNTGLSDVTLQWLRNRNFNSGELADANFLVKAIQTYISTTSNPTVKHVEMGFITRHSHESADHFYQRINAHADKCDFESIKNYKNHQCLLTLLRGVDPELRRKMHLAKVSTYEEAVDIMKAEENATRDSNMCSNTPHEATANRVSAYKGAQKQPYAQQNSSSNYSPHKDSQSSSRPFRCIRCHSTEHPAHACPALIKNKTCDKCQTPGHLAHACLREIRERRH